MLAGSESSKFRACGSNIYDPNIKGRLSFLPSFGEQAGSLDALYYYAPTQTRMQVAQETANNIPCDPCIDASRSSSLYQDNLTEIKVNALFGLNLIKAFYPNISRKHLAPARTRPASA